MSPSAESNKSKRHLRHARYAAAGIFAVGVAAVNGSTFALMRQPKKPHSPTENMGRKVVQAPMARYLERAHHKDAVLPKYYGRHPEPDEKEIRSTEIPGGVEKLTKREVALRISLSRGRVDVEEMDRAIQVFAQRARQDIRWLAMQRREFLGRAKRWANEMFLAGEFPSMTSLQLILLACASVGDSEGARYWLNFIVDHSEEDEEYVLGRLEFNALAGAYGADGSPHEAESVMKNMTDAGFKPDARTYAALVDGWEQIGNRQKMLEVMLRFREVGDAGDLGTALDPRDDALPYYSMARTYAKVGDAPRTVSILKMLQERKEVWTKRGARKYAEILGPSCKVGAVFSEEQMVGLVAKSSKGYEEIVDDMLIERSIKAKQTPLTREVHRLRLQSHLASSDSRRSPLDIEKALRDLLGNRPKSGPLYQSKVSEKCRAALGDAVYEGILGEFDVTDGELIPALPKQEEKMQWRRNNIKRIFDKSGSPAYGIPHTGLNRLRRKNADQQFVEKRLELKKGPALGPLPSGAGVRIPDTYGLPEWMTLDPLTDYGAKPRYSLRYMKERF